MIHALFAILIAWPPQLHHRDTSLVLDIRAASRLRVFRVEHREDGHVPRPEAKLEVEASELLKREIVRALTAPGVRQGEGTCCFCSEPMVKLAFAFERDRLPTLWVDYSLPEGSVAIKRNGQTLQRFTLYTSPEFEGHLVSEFAPEYLADYVPGWNERRRRLIESY